MEGYRKFKGFMVEHGISQQELADLLQLSRTQINLILNGSRGADFKARHIALICRTYGISADEYFFNRQSK